MRLLKRSAEYSYAAIDEELFCRPLMIISCWSATLPFPNLQQSSKVSGYTEYLYKGKQLGLTGKSRKRAVLDGACWGFSRNLDAGGMKCLVCMVYLINEGGRLEIKEFDRPVFG